VLNENQKLSQRMHADFILIDR